MTLFWRSRSSSRGFSQYLFRISTANRPPLACGNFLKKACSRDTNCIGLENTESVKNGNWKTIGPNFSPSTLAAPTNSSNSLSHSTRTFSCVIARGIFSEKMKPGGVLSAQLWTASIRWTAVERRVHFHCVEAS